MTLGALLAIGALGSAGTAWSLGRGGTLARLGALGGVVAIVVLAALAAASPTPTALVPDASGAVPGTLWGGALVPGAYVRLVLGLWAAVSLLTAGVAWLLRGTAGLRPLLPATLAAMVGTAVALSASTLTLAVVASGATGLVSVPVALATSRPSAAGVAAREVRIALATAAVVLAVATVAPVAGRLALANPDAVSAGESALASALGLGVLAIALMVAARVGMIPYHVRVSALADAVPPGAFGLAVAWLALPLVSAAVGVVATSVAPVAPQAGAAQTLVVAAVLLATLAAALVAFLQDDLRHAVGYLTIADLGLVVLAVAALDAPAWGMARTWLLTVAVTKSALAGWAAVTEDRFATRSVPELRGWLRPSPLLGLALALIAVATFGLPGWAVANARGDLAAVAAGSPWSALLLLASLLTLPTYVRWLALGAGAVTTHVDRSAPEFPGRVLAGGPGEDARARRLQMLPARLRLAALGRGRASALAVEQEGSEAVASPSTAARETPTARGQAGLAATGRDGLAARAAGVARRNRTGLLSGAVVALALLAVLVASGAFGLAAAAGEAVPAVVGIGLVGN